MSGLIEELRKRNVLRVGAAYLVVSWFILQFVEVVFPMLGLDDEVLGRNILIVLVIGLPITLLLTWLFEITPGGIKLERDVDRSADTGTRSGRTLDRVVIVVLLIAVCLLLADRFLLQDDSAANAVDADGTASRSVAVLPFVNMSEESETGFFADGLTESLLHILAQFPELRVPARTSVFALRDQQLDIRTIAESLNVDTVLEGSVRQSGNRLRITAQLIEADTGFHLWSKTFDRTMDDVFAVQDEIAESVADALAVTLIGKTVVGGSKASSTDAYRLYLQGLEQKNIGSYSSLPLAEGLFKEALAMDPGYADAKIDLALTYQLQAETGLISTADAHDRATPLLEQVLALNPDNPRGIANSAIIDWQKNLSLLGPVHPATQQARQAMLDAVKIAPNEPNLFTALSNAAIFAGEHEQGLAWIEKGLAIDPLSARLYLAKGRILLSLLDRPEDASRAFARGRELEPEWTAVNFASGDAAFAMEDYAQGILWYNRAMLMDPRDHELPAFLARFLYAFGMMQEGDVMLQRAKAISPDAPWTRGLEVLRQWLAGNTETVVGLASSALDDEIEDRGQAFSIAASALVSSLIDLDQPEQAVEFIESVRPGITSPDYEPPGPKEFSLRLGVVHALRAMNREEQARDIAEAMLAYLDEAAPAWSQNEFFALNMELALGNEEQALEHAVADLSRPLSQNLYWRFNYSNTSWMRRYLDHPRTAPLIRQLEAQSQAAAAQIRQRMGADWPAQASIQLR